MNVKWAWTIIFFDVRGKQEKALLERRTGLSSRAFLLPWKVFLRPKEADKK